LTGQINNLDRCICAHTTQIQSHKNGHKILVGSRVLVMLLTYDHTKQTPQSEKMLEQSPAVYSLFVGNTAESWLMMYMSAGDFVSSLLT